MLASMHLSVQLGDITVIQIRSSILHKTLGDCKNLLDQLLHNVLWEVLIDPGRIMKIGKGTGIVY